MGRDRLLEPLIAAADRALRAVSGCARAARARPADGVQVELSDEERRRAAALMRVNHAGEIAAQALYHGQALAARSDETRAWMLEAARAESDHLAWCEARLAELGSHPSRLNPLWYAGSLAIGALAAAFGDRASLGFVAETERQVEAHLDEHLSRLPAADEPSRAILRQMREDEARHGSSARAAGAMPVPGAVRALMKQTARFMTGTAYWV